MPVDLFIGGFIILAVFLVCGFLLFAVKKNLETRLGDNQGVKDDIVESHLYEEILEKIKNFKDLYKANQKFLNGLKMIEVVVAKDHKNYYNDKIIFHSKKKKIIKRHKRWIKALDERTEDYFVVPFHALSNIKDTPDSSKYPYRPDIHRRVHKDKSGLDKILKDSKMAKKKSKYVTLELVHYTSDNGLKGIKKAYKNNELDLFEASKGSGWTFFTEHMIPDGYNTIKGVREILGLGKQEYSPSHILKQKKHQAAKNPERYLKLKIRVPRELVFVSDTYYKDPKGNMILITKYAIAGMIARKDLVDKVEYGRYATAALLKEDPKKNGKLKPEFLKL